jgi:hypothetical protein
MRLRRRWVLAGLAGLVLALLLLVWGGFALPALIQGEHFYYGLPSRLWADAVRRWHRNNPRQPRPVSTWFGRWMLRLSSRAEPLVLRGDLAAVPVLSDLMQCRDENVRWRSVPDQIPSSRRMFPPRTFSSCSRGSLSSRTL